MVLTHEYFAQLIISYTSLIIDLVQAFEFLQICVKVPVEDHLTAVDAIVTASV